MSVNLSAQLKNYVVTGRGRRLDGGAITQSELALALHIDSSVTHLWVSGKRAVPDHRVPQIAEVLGLTVDQLLGREAEPVVDAQDAADELAAYFSPDTAPARRPSTEPLADRLKVAVMRAQLAVHTASAVPAQPPTPLAQYLRQSNLEQAGLVPNPEAKRYELYCFACGRGVGPAGVLRTIRVVPRRTDPCRTCGGRVFVREIVTERERSEAA